MADVETIVPVIENSIVEERKNFNYALVKVCSY